MTNIGIMQGRLVPPTANRIQCFPRERWADEFALAAQAGLDCIEWIYDAHGADVNPLATDAGVEQLRTLSAQHGVQIRSLCADYFMDFPLLRTDDFEARLGRLGWLISRAADLGIQRIVLPFVDASEIRTDEELQQVADLMECVFGTIRPPKVELHLETSLPPQRFAQLLAAVPYRAVQVNYDSGNSASLGFHPRDEFAAYGSRIGSVHIKDRVCGGGTVPLGQGSTDFPALFTGLRDLGYAGDFILQVARGPADEELDWARQNLAFVRQSWMEGR